MIVALVLLGRYLELATRGKALNSLHGLIELQPKTAMLLQADGQTRDVPLEEVRPMITYYPAGRKIPLDGKIANGNSSIDESMLTGESYPVDKGPGDSVTGGALNLNGHLEIVVERVGKDTVLAQIIQITYAAQSSKAPIQHLVDRVAAAFVPAVLLAAAVTFLIRWLVFHANLEISLIPAVAVLVVACPCALDLPPPRRLSPLPAGPPSWVC